MSEEIWKDIPGFEGLYQVSDHGRIRSFVKWRTRSTDPRIMAIRPDRKGYLRCYIGGRNIPVHRVVATTFLENPQKKPQVNHIDGNKLNNSIGNLEWVTNTENQRHAFKNGLKTTKHLTDATSKPVLQFSKDGDFIAQFKSTCDASRKTGVDQTSICNCCNKKRHRNTAGGFIWKYAQEVIQHEI